jgi:hypothetical protein
MSHLHSKQPDYRRTVTSRFPGYRPPPHLLARIKRFHPTVDLLWEPNRKRWVLAQTDQAQVHVITVLQGPSGEFVAPNLENTLGMLDRSSSVNFANRWAVDRWLRDNITDEVQDPEADSRIEKNIHEFSDRVWHLNQKRVAIVPDPRGGSCSQ